MDIFFATMPRSGSEFVIRLVRMLLGIEPSAIVSLTPGRMINSQDGKSRIFQEMIDKGAEVDYLKQNNIRYVKIESPSNDVLCYDLSVSFPTSK